MNRSTFLRRFAGGIVALVAAPTLLEAKPRPIDGTLTSNGVLANVSGRPRDWILECQRHMNAKLSPHGLYVLLWKCEDRPVIRGTLFAAREEGRYRRRAQFMVSMSPLLRTDIPERDRRAMLYRSVKYQIYKSADEIDRRWA